MSSMTNSIFFKYYNVESELENLIKKKLQKIKQFPTINKLLVLENFFFLELVAKYC